MRLEEGQKMVGLHVVLARQVERAHIGKDVGVSQKFRGTISKIGK